MSITQMNIGILTAGGVCPGVNNLIHSLTIYETSRDNRIIGFNEGFRGLNNNARMELSRKNIEEATTTNSIVFVEAPGHRVTELSTQATFAKYSKVTDVINKQTINNISKYQIKNNYETQGYAVVVVAETCEYQDVMDFLEETDIKVMNPGFVIRDTKACAYDTIMSVKVAREAFEDAQKFRNFVIGGNAKMTFENYLEIA